MGNENYMPITRRRADRTPLPKSKNDIRMQTRSGKSFNQKIGVGIKNTKNLKNKKKSLKKNKNKKRMQKYKKSAYKNHKKSTSKSQKIRKSFSHKSVCQLILLAIHAYNKECSYSQIKRLLVDKMKFKNLKDFQIKKGIKKLVVLKCIKDTSKNTGGEVVHRYIFTKKNLPKNQTLKRKRQTLKTLKNDKSLRQKLRRLAHKANRGGRTYEQVVKDFLDLKKSENGCYFNTIKHYLRIHNMKVSNFVLKKVLERLRSKKVVEIVNCKNFTTGKDIPARKSTPAFLKE